METWTDSKKKIARRKNLAIQIVDACHQGPLTKVAQLAQIIFDEGWEIEELGLSPVRQNLVMNKIILSGWYPNKGKEYHGYE